MQETQVWFLDLESLLEKKMATHSRIIAERTPWTEERGELQSMGSQELEVTQWLNNNKMSKKQKFIRVF